MSKGTRYLNGLLVLLAAPAFAANWTDRGEYDLVLNVRSQASPQKRLELLDSWTQKYPKSELRQARFELYLYAYESLGDGAHMLDTALKMFSDQPGNPVAMYWCTVLVPGAAAASPELLSAGDKAARGLLAGLNGYFTGDQKPPTERGAVELLAHRAIGWIEWQRGDYVAAEREFTEYLRKEPGNAEISAWLGIVLGLDKGKSQDSAALWQLARAAAPGDQNTLPVEQRRQMSALLEHMYVSYHGAPDGLDKLRTDAAANAFPPADFAIESATVVAARKAEEELSRTNPELAAWLGIRKRLEAPDGEKYFAETLLAKPLPRLKGTVIRTSPARNPREVALGMSDPAIADLVLKLSAPLPNDAEPGTKIAFESMAESFSKEPFSLKVTVEPGKIEGWPEKASRSRSGK